MNDLNMREFITSNEGFELMLDFEEQFNCSMALHEPDGELFFEGNGVAYFIPDDFDVDVFKNLILRSLQEGENLIYDTFKENVFETIPGAIY